MLFLEIPLLPSCVSKSVEKLLAFVLAEQTRYSASKNEIISNQGME